MKNWISHSWVWESSSLLGVVDVMVFLGFMQSTTSGTLGVSGYKNWDC
jgi:uncharacterized membrane protein YkgB